MSKHVLHCFNSSIRMCFDFPGNFPPAWVTLLRHAGSREAAPPQASSPETLWRLSLNFRLPLTSPCLSCASFTSTSSPPHFPPLQSHSFSVGANQEVTIETGVTMETVGCSSGGGGGSRLSLTDTHARTHTDTLMDDTDQYCTKNIHSTSPNY